MLVSGWKTHAGLYSRPLTGLLSYLRSHSFSRIEADPDIKLPRKVSGATTPKRRPDPEMADICDLERPITLIARVGKIVHHAGINVPGRISRPSNAGTADLFRSQKEPYPHDFRGSCFGAAFKIHHIPQRCSEHGEGITLNKGWRKELFED